jgi:hypothetical protein
MKIVTVCENGNNRSVQFMHLLRYKYKGSDVIPVGTHTFTKETLAMLYNWADHIIVTDRILESLIPEEFKSKVKVWNVGIDRFPRPFNPELNALAKVIIEQNPL